MYMNVSFLFILLNYAITMSTVSTSDVKPMDESSDRLQRWLGRWTESKLGWHKSDPHPFLLKHGSHLIPHFDSDADTCEVSESKSRIFFPLCGKSVDMSFFAKLFEVDEVVGVDGIRKALLEFADENKELHIDVENTSSISAFEKFSGEKISLLKGDFFALDDDATEGKFDYIFDRASLVAIQPDLREKYVEILGNLIKPGGRILLIVIDRREGNESGRTAGPPFSVDEQEVKRLFGATNWVESIEKVDEVEEDVSQYRMPGVERLFELVFVIKAKM